MTLFESLWNEVTKGDDFYVIAAVRKKFHFQVSPIYAKWTVAEEIEEGRKGEETEEPA